MQLISQLQQSDNYPRGLNLTQVKLAAFRQRLNVMKHGIHHWVRPAVYLPSMICIIIFWLGQHAQGKTRRTGTDQSQTVLQPIKHLKKVTESSTNWSSRLPHYKDLVQYRTKLVATSTFHAFTTVSRCHLSVSRSNQMLQYPDQSFDWRTLSFGPVRVVPIREVCRIPIN